MPMLRYVNAALYEGNLSVTICLGAGVFEHQLSEEFQSGVAFSIFGNIAIEHRAFMVNGATKIVKLSINFDENFLKMTAPF